MGFKIAKSAGRSMSTPRKAHKSSVKSSLKFANKTKKWA